jgi:hypothetical protein
LDDTVRPRPVSFTGFGTTAAAACKERIADAFARLFFAGIDFAGDEAGVLGFLAVEVFWVPMTVQYTTRPNRCTHGFAASAPRLEHPKSLRMRD